MKKTKTTQFLAALASAGAIVCAVIAGTVATAGPSTADPSDQPFCGMNQVPNPKYGHGSFTPCVDTLQSGVPGARGPNGYTPCTGDAASKASPYCHDPNGHF